MTTFKPAKRENVPLLIGLEGSSGSGKTLSALLIAKGIADAIGAKQGREGRVFGIDAERGRMLHYADNFVFMHGAIDPPFRPEVYGDAIADAETAGADVIVIDSFSHEWEGEGGVREWAEELEAAGEKSPKNWMKPKTSHKRLVNKMLAARAHIIVCLRSEEKMRVEAVPQTNPDGSPKMWNGKPSTKMVITPAAELSTLERWVPICEKRFPYEITTSLLLTPQQPGVPFARKLQDQHRPFFPEGRQITSECGRLLAEWSMGGATSAQPSPVPAAQPDITLEQARANLEAATSMDDLAARWRARPMAPFRDALADHLETLKARFTAPPQQETPHGSDYGYDGI